MYTERPIKLITFILAILLYSVSSFCDSSNTYKNGDYDAYSQALYKSEPYWGHVKIIVSGGSFTNLDFVIRDSSFHENVDSMYGINHFTRPEDQGQCINDGRGIKIYPQRLLQTQDLDKVDMISGATWSYRIFKACVKEALKDAKIITNVVDKIKPQKSVSIFSKSTRSLEYLLSKDSYVKVNIYTIHGKLIKRLQDGNQKAGTHIVAWKETFPSGIYFYTLQADNMIVNRKIFEIK